MSPCTIAVTIGATTDAYRLLARAAASSCLWATGLPTYVVGDFALRRFPHLKRANRLKFRLFDLFPSADRILFFDADTLFLRTMDLALVQRADMFYCVRDAHNEWSRADSAELGLPLDEYFNAGFFVASKCAHAELFALAERLYADSTRSRLHDQGFLNLARWRLKIPTVFLGEEYNVCAYGDETAGPDDVVAHFNGSGGLTAQEVRARAARYSPCFQQPYFPLFRDLGIYRLHASGHVSLPAKLLSRLEWSGWNFALNAPGRARRLLRRP